MGAFFFVKAGPSLEGFLPEAAYKKPAWEIHGRANSRYQASRRRRGGETSIAKRGNGSRKKWQTREHEKITEGLTKNCRKLNLYIDSKHI